MIFAFHLIDRRGSELLRRKFRPLHKLYLEAVADRIPFAGPMTTDDGKTMVGSLLCIEMDSRDTAVAWPADAPFRRAGLYASVSMLAFQNLWAQRVGFPPNDDAPVNPTERPRDAGDGDRALGPPQS